MALYEISSDHLSKISDTTFDKVGLKERTDLQRILRKQINVVASDTLVLAEEFGDFEDSRRRIDLLGIDKNANLVVIELKRTEDGGHMDLQAIRYAAMVSAMTFDKAVESHADYLKKIDSTDDARTSILDFLKWDEPDEEIFAQTVRVVLVSADFGKELTTTVMWLNEQGLDIRCVRIKPYSDNGRVLVDVQQMIPLPEATDYQIRIKEKATKERIDRIERDSRMSLRYKFWEGLLDSANKSMDLFSNISPSKDSWISAGSGLSGVHYVFKIRKHDASCQLVFEGEKSENKRMFDILMRHDSEIDTLLGPFLGWQRCNDLKQSYIGISIYEGGYRDNEHQWPATQKLMIENMNRLHEVCDKYMDEIRNGN